MLIVAGLLGVHAAYGGEEPSADPGGPVAKISLPWDQFLVRADVPVFELACGPDFKRYVLEFGQGSDPTEWHPIAVSTHPRPTDPYAAGKVEWCRDSGGRGNLGVWHAGVTSYRYPGREENFNGVFTVRSMSALARPMSRRP